MTPLASLSVLLGLADPAQAAPVARCDIDLGRWCFTHFDGRTTMQQDASEVRWEFRDRADTGSSGIVITENRECRANRDDQWKIAVDDTKPGVRLFRLRSGYCAISVSFPITGKFAASYARFAKYGIVLRDAAKVRSIGDRLEDRL